MVNISLQWKVIKYPVLKKSLCFHSLITYLPELQFIKFTNILDFKFQHSNNLSNLHTNFYLETKEREYSPKS